MNAKQINSTPIINYLRSLNIEPYKQFSSYAMYLSPLRNEIYPSFKVSFKENLWIDYGISEKNGGTLIDLILCMNPNFSVSDAIKSVSDNKSLNFSFQQQKIEYYNNTSPNLDIIAIHPLTYNLKLCEYVRSRGIDFHLANQYVKSVQYRRTPWTFWAVGNRNEKGWSLRSEKFKGCTNQSYSLFTNNSKKLCVMEGVFDFLSYITLINREYIQNSDYLILNSTTNLKSSISAIEKYDYIELYLDRDYSGVSSSKYIKECIRGRGEDKSFLYDGYKDLNEYLISKTIKKPNFKHALRNL
ncbi:toprim domain-containing protein [Sphingobacterium rhinopitheci]|uniref:toprim domain-containing protein n=1 Tax=Sphingobacterium rhinopitheci TaxID=2781960 RepID=UPI001F51BB62|nr:toprim domain-containing protein [Sphingobacterium rhinopitheci]MCI0920554.1 toprim domain-containing protein [Sphingobacterium rhinopitheci]